MLSISDRSHYFEEAKEKPIMSNFLPIQKFGCLENWEMGSQRPE
jgi:hypothetical protein